MAGSPRSHKLLGTGRAILTSNNSCGRRARAEKRSWDELTATRSDWLPEDIRHWYARLCTSPGLNDLQVEKVKFYVGTLLARLTR